MGFLNGKKALITGVASERSIATGIAEAFHREGAELAFTYQGDKLKPRVEDLAHSLNSTIVLPLDVTRDVEIDAVFETLKEKWGALDILVHSIGYAPRELLAGSYLDTVTRQGYAIAHDISAYSFAALAKGARPLMRDRKGALLTLTYLGSQRFVPMYNVMGAAKASLEASVRYLAAELGPLNIRVNAISAGPIRTLASSAVGGILDMIHHVEQVAPLRRTVTQLEVGNTAAFLCSDLSSGITGQVLYVDAGYEI